MKRTIVALFLGVIVCLVTADANAQTLIAKRKCTGSCLAPACPAGYTVSSTSCNCNASCLCSGNTVCTQPGGGSVDGGRCVDTCAWTFVMPEEIEDPIGQSQKSWGPRRAKVEKDCTIFL